MKCRVLPRAGGHRPAAAQRQLLRRAPPRAVPRPGRQGDRRPRHARAGRAGARRRVGRQGQPGGVGPPARARLRGRRPVHRARHRRLQRRRRRRTPGRSRRQRGLHAASRSTCATEYGYDVPTAAAATRRVPCSSCGLSQAPPVRQGRAVDGGYDVVATGHNLDDEAAVLFGNTLRWDVDYLGPPAARCCRRATGFPRKVKPLVRLTERETAAYCVVRGHRLHRRGVPDGRRQQAPRLQGRAQRDRGRARRARRPRSTSASSTGWRRCWPTHAAADRAGLGPCRTLRRARRPARCARSAACVDADGRGPRTACPVELRPPRAARQR